MHKFKTYSKKSLYVQLRFCIDSSNIHEYEVNEMKNFYWAHLLGVWMRLF